MFRAVLSLALAVTLVTPALAQAEGEPQNRLVDGQRQGRWRLEGRNGKVDEGSYEAGKKNGEWVTTSPDGVVRSRVTFAMGVPKGKATYYFPDGSIMETGTWNVDHWEGEYERFYANGNKSCSFSYDAKGQRVGVQTYFHENGQKMFEGRWEAGRISGALSIFNEEGRKIMERNYDASGKYQGSQQVDLPAEQGPGAGREFHGTGNFTIYDANGRKEQVGQFKNGKLMTGCRYFYDSNGRLSKTEKYAEGKLVGTVKK